MKTGHPAVAATAALTLLAGCASGPVVPAPPRVEVRLQSTVVTPEVIRFVGKVVIRNVCGAPQNIERVDYGADLHDAPLFSSSFAELHPMNPWATQTVTLPFQVAMKDVVDQVEDVLAEESVRVTLTGTVVPVGWQPIDFRATKVIPIPRLPEVAYEGSHGDPFRDGEFTVYLRVRNVNDFPITRGQVKTWLRLNGRKYELLRTSSFERLGPGEGGRIALTMKKTRGKGISAIVNVLKNRAAEVAVGGAMTFRTPHGLFHLPIEISPDGVASPLR